MATLIYIVLGNFTVTFFVIGLAVSAVAIAHHPAPRRRAFVYEALLRWFLFFSIGASMLYNFVAHVFFGEMAARMIGWADSPFQVEVGLASLGFAVVGFIAFRGGWQVRLAAIVGPACFLVGAGVGHLYQIAKTHNMAPGNAGSILYTDFLIPLVGFMLLWLAHRSARESPRGG
ncbi:MAG TPA: DUF6790 family protein [Casimicrobiaceae bacterium]|nr:DUF6790 family protein [Casimicrobiaceae bacterium]